MGTKKMTNTVSAKHGSPALLLLRDAVLPELWRKGLYNTLVHSCGS